MNLTGGKSNSNGFWRAGIHETLSGGMSRELVQTMAGSMAEVPQLVPVFIRYLP